MNGLIIDYILKIYDTMKKNIIKYSIQIIYINL